MVKNQIITFDDVAYNKFGKPFIKRRKGKIVNNKLKPLNSKLPKGYSWEKPKK